MSLVMFAASAPSAAKPPPHRRRSGTHLTPPGPPNRRHRCRACSPSARRSGSACRRRSRASRIATVSAMRTGPCCSGCLSWPGAAGQEAGADSGREAGHRAFELRRQPCPVGGPGGGDNDGGPTRAADDAGDLSIARVGGGPVAVDDARTRSRPEAQPRCRGFADDVSVALFRVVSRAETVPVGQRLRARPGRRVEVAADAVVRSQQGRGEGARVGPYRVPARRIANSQPCRTAAGRSSSRPAPRRAAARRSAQARRRRARRPGGPRRRSPPGRASRRARPPPADG